MLDRANLQKQLHPLILTYTEKIFQICTCICYPDVEHTKIAMLGQIKELSRFFTYALSRSSSVLPHQNH